MLFTTSESLHENLPYHDQDTGLIITADARIDNRHELALELKIENNEFISDSYFILKSYEKWGENCPKYLLGDFAFTIWDENKKKLFCARDHMGVKPFYYYQNDEIFIFGTEIKTILTLDEIHNKINNKKVALYLSNIRSDNLTFFENIFSLNPAEFVVIDSKNVKIS